MGGQNQDVFIHIAPKAELCLDGAEHQFTDWRDFPDGRGGEQICAKCGLGAMEHSLRVSD